MGFCSECQEYICVEALINPCDSNAVIQLPIKADQTSNEWHAVIEFSGMAYTVYFEAMEQYYILFPTKFLNENYVHKIRIYNPDGILFGCISISTKPTRNFITEPIIIDYEMKSIDITITESGSQITNDILKDKIITDLSTNGQSYNSTFWNKPISSNILTSSLLTFSIGQVVTITYK